MKKNSLYNCDFLENLFQYVYCISIFVYGNKHYLTISNKENYNLDMKADLDLCLKKNLISIEEYNLELNSTYYRGGIWQLHKENFESFLKLDGVLILDKSDLLTLLFYGFDKKEQERLYAIVENHLAFNTDICQNGELSDFKKINQIASRLPLFYINFDTNVYLHMNWDRSHENYAYDDWFAKALDFGYLIPDEFCYWKIDGRDFWKFRQI